MLTQLFIRIFIHDAAHPTHAKTRRAYGVLAGALGIVCNLLLFGVKLAIAFWVNSITIAADAVNNLSDAGSSIVTLFGFRLADRPPDEDHPFGHGRMEYIAALVVAILIIAVGLQFLRSSYERITHPAAVEFSWIALAILVASLGVKVWMYSYNRYIGHLIDSEVVKAAAFDSLSDVLVTSITILSLLLARFTAYPLDGWFGLVVGGFVIYGGVKIVRDSTSPLLGDKPDAELVAKLRKRLLATPKILGVHDIIIHSYGPSHFIASAHAEADYRTDPFEIHNVLDSAEKHIGNELHMLLTLHYDPIDPDDPESRRLTGLAESVVSAIDPFLHIHDFRVLSSRTNEVRICFDVVVPRDAKHEHAKLRHAIIAGLRAADPRLNPVVEIENSFV